MLCVFPSKAPCWVVCRKFRQTTFSFKFVYTLSIHLYPHTHEGCDSMSIPCSSHQERFQSTHPRRVWPKPVGVITLLLSFNPHTHEGCDLLQQQYTSRQKSFNPHTHEGCDENWPLSRRISQMFQSTHPRRVWHPQQLPLWQSSLFQSTHPRRVWRRVLFGTAKVRSFNPHTHEGCDLARKEFFLSSSVSIHTPTKGVTHDSTRFFCSHYSFNPHTHEGCDYIGARRVMGGRSFNPHTHEGCDNSRS